MIKWIAIVLLILFSCTDKSIQSKIHDADRIEIIDKESNYSYTETRKEVVEGFKEVLAGHPEQTDCPTQGTILFKKGDITILEIGYYKDASACNFLVVNEGDKKMGYRLSDHTLVYLGLYFQNLKKEHGVRHN